jgi:TonB family protein
VFTSAISLLLTATPAANLPDPEWPTVRPGRVLTSPDWSDSRTYPPIALDKDEQGSVLAETLIDSKGQPQACRVVKSSDFPELDSGSCERLMQMRFEPARDGNGKAIPSRYVKSLNWRLTDAFPFASATLRIHLRIEDQHLASCEVQGGEGPYVQLWAESACSYLTDVPYFFGSHSRETADATLEIRLDAGDGSPSLQSPWVSGSTVAVQKISFAISPTGEPINCTPLENRGFGPRGMMTLSPCGPLLQILYFQRPPLQQGQPPERHGTFETRVYLLGSTH